MEAVFKIISSFKEMRMHELYLDTLLRIGFRPRWNYTRTILNRENDSTRLWDEVERYLLIRHPGIASTYFFSIKDRISESFEKQNYDLVLLCYADELPKNARDTYKKWHHFLSTVFNAFNLSPKMYLLMNLANLNSDERKVIESIKTVLPVQEFESAYSSSPPSFYSRLNERYTDIESTLFTRTLIKSGIADWAVGLLEWFNEGHLESSSRIIDYLKHLDLPPVKQGGKKDDKEIDIRIREIIKEVHVQVLVICPHCGAKTPQGVMKCSNCGALL